ncbi:unnamed protein product [Urochloa decumbens]|uniref:Uncharacterized protein n=1 Tax=Urochloa decumbens TaxID=240449 RepID=A0ABC9DDL7_9POAL
MAAAPALCTAISAAQLIRLLDLQPGGGTTAAATQAQALGSAVRAFLPLVAAGSLFTAVTLIHHRHFRRAAAAVAAGNQRRQSEMLTLLLCVSAGLLYFVLFVAQAPGGGVDDPAGAAARELVGLAALRVLPAAATVTFYLGMLLIIIRHIRAGGEGGGTAVELLAKMAMGAAAGLVCLMAVAIYGA